MFESALLKLGHIRQSSDVVRTLSDRAQTFSIPEVIQVMPNALVILVPISATTYY